MTDRVLPPYATKTTLYKADRTPKYPDPLLGPRMAPYTIVVWVGPGSVKATSTSSCFVFRKTRQAIEAVRHTIAVGTVGLNIAGMDGIVTVIPATIVIPTVILISH